MEQQKNNFLGFFVNLFSISVFATLDMAVKELTKTMPVIEILFYRSILALPLLLIIIYFKYGLDCIKPKNIKFHILRCVVGTVGMVFIILSYKYLPLGETAGILYTSPIILTVMSVIFFKEKIRYHRTIALIIGFVGALLILKPGADFNFYLLLPLVAAILWSLLIIIMRKLSETDNIYSITFIFFCFGSITGFVYLMIYGFSPINDTKTILLLLTCGVCAVVSQLTILQAIKLCDTTLFASSKYLHLFMAVMGGYFVFNEVLPNQSIFGMCLIALSGIYLALRERNTNKKVKLTQSYD